MEKPLIGISSCLLGNEVRYDGQAKLMHYLRDVLGNYVDFVALCPEVESGMPIPREAIRLVDIDGETHLRTVKSNEDKTEMIASWSQKSLVSLQEINLCGYIFKAKSPSCGVFRVKRYSEDGRTLSADQSGIFAEAFRKIFPLIPVEEDGRLNDLPLRENFIERIFAMMDWYTLNEKPRTIDRLMKFHQRWKYQLMAHSTKNLKEMGHFIAIENRQRIDDIYEHYFAEFITTLGEKATVKRNVNTLQHIMGYFKKDISADEKSELVKVIEDYYNRLIPLIVPITLLNHYVRKYKPEYLLDQTYLKPHPMELMLRNHV